MKICSLNSDTHDVTLCPFYLLAQAIAWLSSHKKRDSALDFLKKYLKLNDIVPGFTLLLQAN